MRRRDFVGLIGAAVSAPFVAMAQEPGRTYRIGFLIPAKRQTPPVAAFFDELRVKGFIEGENLVVIPGGFEATDDNLAQRARELVDAKLDAIVAGPEAPLRALRKLTDKIPLIGVVEDMVDAGLVTSFAHPGGNITGISLLSPELDGKRQDILIEAVPGARRIAAIVDAKASPPSHLEELQQAGQKRGIEILVFGVRQPGEISSVIDAANAAGAEALNFLATPLFSIPGTQNNRAVMQRVNALHLLSIFQWPETAEVANAPLAYGPRFVDIYRQRAKIVARILRGQNPSEIPVEQPSRFELVVNLKAAKAMGRQLPAGLILRADKLIE
jgi:putative tryptophan/tyrosine transport system substrate-binding protein